MKQPLLKQLGTILFWTAVLTVSLWFFVNNVSGYFTGELEPRKANEKWWLILHFSGALCILIFGPLQFWPWFRNRFWKVHRIAGRFYIGGSLLSALTVFYLLTNYTLPGSIPSLGLLAVIWIFTTLAALRFALKKNFKLHKQFMIRSYICGLAFVFIRLLPRFDDATGWFQFMNNDEVRFTVYEWICWVYPLMITEFLLVWYPSLKKQAAKR